MTIKPAYAFLFTQSFATELLKDLPSKFAAGKILATQRSGNCMLGNISASRLMALERGENLTATYAAVKELHQQSLAEQAADAIRKIGYSPAIIVASPTIFGEFCHKFGELLLAGTDKYTGKVILIMTFNSLDEYKHGDAIQAVCSNREAISTRALEGRDFHTSSSPYHVQLAARWPSTPARSRALSGLCGSA